MIVTLIEPQIPPNTGNIARLVAATEAHLEIVGNIGFDLSDKSLKRAGLDYWDYVNWSYFEDLESYMEQLKGKSVHFLTKTAQVLYTQRKYSPNDYLVFGSETKGIPQRYLNTFADHCCKIPMKQKAIRSLNLSNAVSIVLYEAIRQMS